MRVSFERHFGLCQTADLRTLASMHPPSHSPELICTRQPLRPCPNFPCQGLVLLASLHKAALASLSELALRGFGALAILTQGCPSIPARLLLPRVRCSWHPCVHDPSAIAPLSEAFVTHMPPQTSCSPYADILVRALVPAPSQTTRLWRPCLPTHTNTFQRRKTNSFVVCMGTGWG